MEVSFPMLPFLLFVLTSYYQCISLEISQGYMEARETTTLSRYITHKAVTNDSNSLNDATQSIPNASTATLRELYLKLILQVE